MALRHIRVYGDEILTKKAKPVANLDTNTFILLDDMLDTMREHDALGLAAPQVGVLRRVAVVETEDALYEMVNPEIVEQSGSRRRNEACLSVPGKSGDLDRPEYVKVRATNRSGEIYEIEADDVLASALCHEIDHLDGVLYLDRAVSIKNEESAAKGRGKKKT